MNEKEFCYWLKSAFELSDIKSFNEEQTKLIKEHLDLVFNKVTSPDVTQYPFAYPMYPTRPYEVTCMPTEGPTLELDCDKFLEKQDYPNPPMSAGGTSAGDIKYCSPEASC